jgi:hypothetical protein
LAIIDLDTPSAEVVEISSSCELSIFSSKVDPQHVKGDGGAPEESSSASIGELWSDIDKSDEISCGGAFAGGLLGGVLREWSSLSLISRVSECAVSMNGRALVGDAPGSSSTPPKGRGKGSVKNRASQILSAAPGSISPHMRRSFVDRQYSPSTGMDRSEWKIILEELTRMGHRVRVSQSFLR